MGFAVTWLAIAGGVATAVLSLLGLAAVIGAIWARLRSSSDETTAELWRQEAEARKAQTERLIAEIASLRVRVEHLESENKMLRTLHDNREEMTALKEAITAGFASLSTLLIAHQTKGE